jgi:hypothetical protein
MKKLLLLCGVCLLAAIGCFEPVRMREEAPKTDKDKVTATPVARPPQVRADSITESNAHAKAQELAAELEFDEKQGEKTH